MRLALRLSYLGDRFLGSQQQTEERTVEGEVIAACRRLELFSDWREARFCFAGRTDRGVHARGQVCAFDTPVPDRAQEALSLQLPRDIWCTGIARVPGEFHPRHDARSRTYRYLFPDLDLDTAAMDRAAGSFVGRFDYSRFGRVEGKNPERVVLAARVFREEGFPVFEVTAWSFLWQMVRSMAGVLEAVGRGEAGGERIRELLAEPSGPRVPPAPAEGLILWDVDCGITFQELAIDHRSRDSLAFLWRHHALMARICRVLQERTAEP
ncbi:MAG: tRNA pseudouridine(38-40) synthase TruA [Methanomicrobiales archaeon]|nr:tRNA pseudouridine(38-40) synthase TruA [Methanomicrobiales archaeon]